MAIGGFNGTDPSPTLAQFQQYVADGKIHCFIAGGGGGGWRRWASGSATSQEIATWVAAQLHRHHGRRHDPLRPHESVISAARRVSPPRLRRSGAWRR